VTSQPVREPVAVASIEALYRDQYRRFLGFALGIVGDPETAHDAVQETFARAIRSREQLHSADRLPNWLWRVLANVCLAARESRSRTSSGGDDPVADVASALQWSELRAAVAALPERQRLVVFLRHYADLDYNAIADVLEIERGTVAATLHTAHERLRDALALEEVTE
jgi:RNA polymerase sigma-70 factor, ECF subfamily